MTRIYRMGYRILTNIISNYANRDRMRRGPITDFLLTPKLRQWLQMHPRWDAETKQDKLDRFIFKAFPFMVCVFAVFAMALFFLNWGNHATLGHFLYSLCVSYTACFIILGLPVLLLTEHHVLPAWKVIFVLFTGSALLGLAFWFALGPETNGLNRFISGFYWFISSSGLEITIWSTVLGVIVLMVASVLASYGVLAVVVAYFRRDYHRILLSLEKNDDSKLCRTSRKYFMVPEIIDVTEVTLDPEVDDTRFQKDVFIRMLSYEIIAGLIIASYLFLNPVFLETIMYGEMMTIIMLLSLFVSTLVVPVSIVRSLGARAHSKGNRPYVLWEGMKRKIFHPSFYVALFLTLLWISLYTQMDGLRIITHYVGYLVYMGCLGAIVAFIYVNTFYVPFKNGIIRNFYQRKNDGKE